MKGIMEESPGLNGVQGSGQSPLTSLSPKSDPIRIDDGSDVQQEDTGLFVVDTEGSVAEQLISSVGDLDSMLDKFSSPPLDVSKVLTPAALPAVETDTKERLWKASCFNCGGEHMLDKCDLPHDERRINGNRMAFINKKRTMSERYLDLGISPDAKPGYISDGLRVALDLGPNDIPLWIYRMRRMGPLRGYPPAYLKQTSLDTVGELQAINSDDDKLLEFHTGDNSPIRSVEETSEEGDEFDSPPTINTRKMIQYLGFNAYSDRLIDLDLNFRVPDFDNYIFQYQVALNEQFNAEQQLRGRGHPMDNPGAKRRGPSLSQETKKQRIEAKKDNVEVVDMDMSDSDDEAYAIPPPPPPPQLQSTPAQSTLEENGNATRGMVVSPIALGSSKRMECGTPVGLPRSQSDKPGLEMFRDGVVPFTHEKDDEAHRGFFMALMREIKSKR